MVLYFPRGEFSSGRRIQRRHSLKIFRILAISATQLPLLLLFGARFDLLFGFNHTEAGWHTLLALMTFLPLCNLFWLAGEIVLFLVGRRKSGPSPSGMMLLLPLLFFIESLAIDLFILAHARM